MTAKTLCSIPDCGKPSCKRGFCNAHYIRYRRHGDPLAGRRSPNSNFCGAKWCPAAKKIWKAIHYLRNSDQYKDKAIKWHLDNPDYKTNYFARDDVKVAMRAKAVEWRKANPERKRESDKKFIKENKHLVTSYKARYRAAKRQATPPWLTDSQIEEIQAVYLEAQRLTMETGIPYEVDHIIPLAGKVVSGLHVPWNLRAIPKDQNNRRPRIYIA